MRLPERAAVDGVERRRRYRALGIGRPAGIPDVLPPKRAVPTDEGWS
jgi:hypothetical protein